MFIALEDALFSCMYLLKEALVSHHIWMNKNKRFGPIGKDWRQVGLERVPSPCKT